jgi:serine/threonine protein phosphatase PrpC
MTNMVRQIPDESQKTARLEVRPLTHGPFMDVNGMTSQGRRRRRNEDSFLTAELTRSVKLGASTMSPLESDALTNSVKGRLLAVADGMAHAGAGGLAGNVALRVMAGYVTNVMEWFVDEEDEDHVQEELEAAFERCRKRIRREARRLGYGDHPVGAMLTMAYIVWPKLYLARVGDSEAYLYRKQRLRRLTSARTLSKRVSDQGDLHHEGDGDARYRHLLIDAECSTHDVVDVEFHCIQLEPGDCLLLCTDGLLEHVAEHEIASHLACAVTSATCCSRLIALAHERGSTDNITVAAVRIHSLEFTTAPRT